MKSHQIAGLKPGKYGIGERLYLRVAKSGTRSWTFNYTSPTTGKRREMGLGAWPAVGLTDAKEQRNANNALLRAGEDPMTERVRSTDVSPILRDLALATFEARKAELKGDGKPGNWFSPLRLHVLPTLGDRDIRSITQHDIAAVIKPNWDSKGPTMEKALDRLGLVWKHAAVCDIAVDIQTVPKARLLLGKSRHTTTHIPAMPFEQVPAFYAALGDTVGQLALRLLILTGTRSAPVRFARIDQFDGDVWTIPAEHMKGARGATSDFRVPLSPAALVDVQTAIKTTARDGFLFPGPAKRVARPISDMTMAKVMKDRDLPFRPHGFRSALKQWMVQTTATPWEVGETILAHQTETKVGRAYARDADYLAQRRVVMDQWAAHVTGGGVAVTDQRTELEAELARIKNLLADMPNN